jgi:hypothetical protein
VGPTQDSAFRRGPNSTLQAAGAVVDGSELTAAPGERVRELLEVLRLVKAERAEGYIRTSMMSACDTTRARMLHLCEITNILLNAT